MQFTIPNTPCTARMRGIWYFSDTGQSFEDWYIECCQIDNPSPNGRALAAIAFDRACTHWPDFHRPTDTTAINAWGAIIDEHLPLATPDSIVAAVDSVAARGERMVQPGDLIVEWETLNA